MPKPHIIDVQHHCLPADYVNAVGRKAIADAIVSGCCPEWSPEISLDAMDRNNITCAILSLASPGFHFSHASNAAGLARLCNEEMADHCRVYPERFGFLATLPLPHVTESLEEIAYALDQLGADGVCLLTNYGGTYLGDITLDPILDELDRRGVVALVHPADVNGRRPLDTIPAATLEFPFDTSRAVTNLLFSGTLARLRRIRFIFCHAGGTIPFLADRIGRLERRSDLAGQAPEGGAVREMKRHYYDIALSAGARTLQPLLNFVPPEQILFASDFPFAGEDTMTSTARSLHAQDLSDSTLAAIECGTAHRLFPTRFAAAPGTGLANRQLV